MRTGSQRTDRTPRLSVRLARSDQEVLAAQRLRWLVFVEEQGASIATPRPGYDIDDLDRHCEHLIAVDEHNGIVIGTYRLLTAEAARRAGGYYSEREFDMDGLKRPDVRLLELGRSCVLADYRTGGTIALLWSGLADFIVATRHDALIGCASIALGGNAAAGSRLAREVCQNHCAPVDMLVTPRMALPYGDGSASEGVGPLPPLLKGYLRSGAVVCGEPCWDPDFDCADLLLHLALDRLVARYARHFLPSPGDTVSSPCRMIAV